MSEYSKQDIDVMVEDRDLMQLVKLNNKLNKAVNDLYEDINSDVVKVELALNGRSKLINSNYRDDYTNLNELNNRLDWLMVRYCAFNQITRADLENILSNFED